MPLRKQYEVFEVSKINPNFYHKWISVHVLAGTQAITLKGYLNFNSTHCATAPTRKTREMTTSSKVATSSGAKSKTSSSNQTSSTSRSKSRASRSRETQSESSASEDEKSEKTTKKAVATKKKAVSTNKTKVCKFNCMGFMLPNRLNWEQLSFFLNGSIFLNLSLLRYFYGVDKIFPIYEWIAKISKKFKSYNGLGCIGFAMLQVPQKTIVGIQSLANFCNFLIK